MGDAPSIMPEHTSVIAFVMVQGHLLLCLLSGRDTSTRAFSSRPAQSLGDISGTQALDSPELTVLSWPLQVDGQTEENDMNKRRRRGFNNLDEVCVRRVSLNKGPFPDNQWLRPARP